MKQLLMALWMLALCSKANSQELYVFSEPASNMPAKSVGLKLTASFPKTPSFTNRYMPEAMIGINKYWMVHISGTLSDYYTRNLRLESGRLYAKYRFYSNDEIHKHFRMAAFGDVAFTRSPFVYDDANLEGDNSGPQAGLIATQLFNKLAVSSTVAYNNFFTVKNDKLFTAKPSYHLLSYSLSAGYLLLPKEYKNYGQTNVNAYVELLGSKSLDQKFYALDLAPALQFIFNSNSKVNIGYRFQMTSSMHRMATNVWQLGFEHTSF